MKITAHARRILISTLLVAATAALAGDGESYPANSRSWKVAQAGGATGAPSSSPPGEVQALRAELAKVQDANARMSKKLGEIESGVDAMRNPRRFVVLAMFKYNDPIPAQLKDLPAGQTSGLPTLDYDWPCDGCRKSGNMRWHAGDSAKDAAIPKGWDYTHMAAKSFGSAYEANSWLDDTEEGRFVKKNASAIVTFTTTEYSPVASGAAPTTARRIK